MDDGTVLDLTPDNIEQYGICGYKDAKKHIELRKKIAWFAEYYPKGLRIKIIALAGGGYQGMIEYIPGEYAHRPVSAEGYMFIHCIFCGFKSKYKNKGYGKKLLTECIDDARQKQMKGVAVVTRKGAFMANSTVFLQHGFIPVDKTDPDFELLALKFDPRSKDPRFILDKAQNPNEFGEGITVLRSPQCPYTEKNVNAILDLSKKLGMKTNLIELKSAKACQSSPCAFGSFCIVQNGKVISHHPISVTRFSNIINSKGKK
jgi:hypothetical protein